MTGGAGDDVFVYQTTASLFVSSVLVDSVTGGSGTDTIQIDNQDAAFTIASDDSFTGMGAVESITAKASDQVISITLHDDASDAGIAAVDLSGDTDTTGDNVIDISAESSVGMILTGSAGIDTITGGSGNDAMTGGAGADIMFGGVGNEPCPVGRELTP